MCSFQVYFWYYVTSKLAIIFKFYVIFDFFPEVSAYSIMSVSLQFRVSGKKKHKTIKEATPMIKGCDNTEKKAILWTLACSKRQ